MRWRKRETRAASLLAVALTVCAVLSGCDTGPVVDVGPHFVTPPLIHYTSVLWPVPLQLVGARPGSRLRLVATLPTEHGVWSSSATYTVPGDGTVDLATERPQLARFTQPDSAGLFWSLRGPKLDAAETLRLWMGTTLAVTIDAYDAGRVVASRVFRLDALGTVRQPVTVYSRELDAAATEAGDRLPPLGLPDPPPPTTQGNGPVGQFFSATSIERPRTPAVVVFDDPAIGASADYIAPLLAQFGASVFVLPVKRDPDGVHAVSAVDSSTVTAVLDWLQARPDVNARTIFAYGTSQSEQFALWAAWRFSSRFNGVFAAGGVSAPLCLAAGETAPTFEDGVGVECLHSTTLVDGRATIPLDAVTGPVVLGCADRDAILPNACAWQRAVLGTHPTRAADRLVIGSGSAHDMTVPPGLPIGLPQGNGQATQKARIAFWDAVGGALLRAARQ